MLPRFQVDVLHKVRDDGPGKPVVVAASGGSDYTPLTVETIDNHVYFYSNVDSDRCLDLIRQISNVDRQLRNERVNRSLPDDQPPIPIYLHIYSQGGSLPVALNMYDQLRTFPTPIISVIEGLCASAGTLLSLACSKRLMYPHSVMLIHQLSSIVWGTHEQFKDEMKLHEMYMDMLYRIYEERSNMNRDEIVETLKHDFWMSAEDCLERGFVDEIIDVPKNGA